MPRISTDNYDTVASWNGSQDLFVVEQPDGTKVATPAMVKQYVLGNSIDDIYSVMGQNGAKNLLVPKWTETQTTENGVTYTFNVDGTVVMNTDASGATANTNCNLKNVQASTDNIYPAGTYKLSGCPSGGSVTTYRIWACAYRPGDSSSPLTGNLYDEGNGVTFTVNETFQLAINLTVRKNYVCNNLTWKPMLRYASDTDNTYEPYAMTNKQLTDGLDTTREQISDLTTKKVNTWMPDVYDFDTKVKTLNSNICTTYVQKIGDLTVAYLGVDSGTNLGSFSTMMQLRGFPEGCTRCIGGYIYNSSLESSPRVVQASNVGIYFRPNITGNMSSGFVSALLFFN